MCGIIGVFKHEGEANVEIYEGLLMLQHRGQDSGVWAGELILYRLLAGLAGAALHGQSAVDGTRMHSRAVAAWSTSNRACNASSVHAANVGLLPSFL